LKANPRELEGERKRASLGLVSKIVIVAFIATIGVSIPAWFDARAFPTAPVFSLEPLPCEVSYLLLGLLVGSLTVLFFRPGAVRWTVVLWGAFGAFVIYDQSRLMPYLLQYAVMVSIIGYALRGGAERTRAVWGMCQVVLVSIYIWAGIQKLNRSFVVNGFPWFIEPFVPVIPEELRFVTSLGGLLVPFVETALGVMLLTEKRRRAGVVGLTAMHLFILVCLGPFGHNWNHAVWPWNVAMAAFLWILFREPFDRRAFRGSPRLFGLVTLFFLVLPALNLVGLWDDYLSHALYSRRSIRGGMAIASEDLKRLPDDFKAAVILKNGGMIELSFVNYSMTNLGLPVYPAERVFTDIGAAICRRYGLSQESATVVYGKPDRRTGAASSKVTKCGG
jgi:hypothetical protein